MSSFKTHVLTVNLEDAFFSKKEKLCPNKKCTNIDIQTSNKFCPNCGTENKFELTKKKIMLSDIPRSGSFEVFQESDVAFFDVSVYKDGLLEDRSKDLFFYDANLKRYEKKIGSSKIKMFKPLSTHELDVMLVDFCSKNDCTLSFFEENNIDYNIELVVLESCYQGL